MFCFLLPFKINLGLVKNNGNPGGTGGSLWPWRSGWEGDHSDPGNLGGRGGGGQKNLAIRRGGGVDFSGITQCHIPR